MPDSLRPPPAPAGFFPDPDGNPAIERWWDGAQWTSATRPTVGRIGDAGPPPPPAKRRIPNWAIVLGTVAVVVVGVTVIGTAITKDDSPSPGLKTGKTYEAATNTPTYDPEAAQSAAASEAAASSAAQAAIDAEKARQRDKTQYREIGDRDWALIAKDPDSHRGERVVLYGKVTQFDSATGTTALRANTAGQPQDASYNYNINTVVEEGIDGALKDVVQDDLITIYGRVNGSKTYDTTIGGSTSVPEIEGYVVEVTGSDR